MPQIQARNANLPRRGNHFGNTLALAAQRFLQRAAFCLEMGKSSAMALS
jgi:hypothetical protein